MKPKKLLIVIIEKELEEDAQRALRGCGVDTFTTFPASGEGVKEHLNRWVDPEKVIIFSVVLEKEVETAMAALKNQAQITAPGVGIAFTVPVDETIGIGVP